MSLCIVDGGRRRQRAMQPVDARQSSETEPNELDSLMTLESPMTSPADRYRTAVTLLVCSTFVAAGPAGPHNTLTESETAGGWRLLFDGASMKGWRSFRKTTLNDGWRAIDGAITRVARAGYLVTEEQFENFELKLQWRISPGGNSGIFFRLDEQVESVWHSAPEMQILDDAKHADGGRRSTSAGANYGLHAPRPGATLPAGRWNDVRLLVDRRHVEYWLNGMKVVEYELGSPDWNRRVATSKFNDKEQFGKAKKGHIALQDHGDPVWFRNIRIRPIIRNKRGVLVQPDFGPAVAATFVAAQPEGNVTHKGVAVVLREDRSAGVLFDTELLRYSAGWLEAPPILQGTAFDGHHGRISELGKPLGFASRPRPGWSVDGDFSDQRPLPHGPLPDARYQGMYLHGDQVIFSYRIGAAAVLDMPGLRRFGKATDLTRTIQIGPSSSALHLSVCDGGAPGIVAPIGDRAGRGREGPATGHWALFGSPEQDDVRFVMVHGAPEAARWRISKDHQLVLALPPLARAWTMKIVAGQASRERIDAGAGLHEQATRLPDLAALTRGGPPRWPEAIEVSGRRGDGDAAYVVDTITLPNPNPWQCSLKLGGLDFFNDGTRAAVCSWTGDVWIVSGIDASLEAVTWRRFAAGLHQPLGLRIVDDVVHVLGRDQITRLHDLNGDGEADHYENFNNDVYVTMNFHEFAFDLQTDRDGNFYFLKGGPVRRGGRGFEKITPHHGCLLRVTADGASLDVVATGLRAPNGMSIGPKGQITCADNEGTWTPRCRLNWIEPGGFYGVVDLAHRASPPTATDPPICWLPMGVDNSSGGQVWVTSDRWGPLEGRLLHTSYGTCSLFLVLMDQVGGRRQGGVCRLPLNFDSGVARGRFNPADGQLYLVGLRGWQTRAAQDGAFHRVRYTGRPLRMPESIRFTKRGIRLAFTCALDRELAEDVESYELRHWNYQWTEGYGSKRYSVAEPGTERPEGEVVQVDAATLLDDGRTVLIEAKGLQPVMQMRIRIDLEARDGGAIANDLHVTIHELGE
ncbi:MAG: hypothetical protein CMJ18_25025 [Phycisphaeraceae bacterium]|nr:hypothetical protein [Phycisphaeraceae bacterium]